MSFRFWRGSTLEQIVAGADSRMAEYRAWLRRRKTTTVKLEDALTTIETLLTGAGWNREGNRWRDPTGRVVHGSGAALQRYFDYFVDDDVAIAGHNRGIGSGHPTVPVRVGDQAADIDVAIAPLIERLWQLNIRTSLSCENHAGRCWIVFESAADAERLITMLVPRDDSDSPELIWHAVPASAPDEATDVWTEWLNTETWSFAALPDLSVARKGCISIAAFIPENDVKPPARTTRPSWRGWRLKAQLRYADVRRVVAKTKLDGGCVMAGGRRPCDKCDKVPISSRAAVSAVTASRRSGTRM